MTKSRNNMIWSQFWNRMNKVIQLIVVTTSTDARVLHLFIVVSFPPVLFSLSCKTYPYYIVSSAPPNRELLCWDVAATVDLFLICLLHIVGSQVVNCKCWPLPLSGFVFVVIYYCSAHTVVKIARNLQGYYMLGSVWVVTIASWVAKVPFED